MNPVTSGNPSDQAASSNGQGLDAVSDLVGAFFQRRVGGEVPIEEPREVPAARGSLASILSHQDLLRSRDRGSGLPVGVLKWPEVGDELFGFRLRRKLGEGAFASVFLAEQGDLAGRPVVLKLSAIEGREPQTLAQLQHTHIVPIHSVHEDPSTGLRAVCMPYFGGASLAEVLRALFASAPVPTRGRQLVAALDRVMADAAPGGPVLEVRTPRAELAGLDYQCAVAWVIARLAEGLQHAHDRGVLHCDVKPSNVLLGADGQPLLLDFNLARNSCAASVEASLGGTVAYMAPEHLRAMTANNASLAGLVDHRSDLYSLGLVLFEMMTGQRPFAQGGSYSVFPVMLEAMALERSQVTPSLRARRADVPWGLESIVRKCLAPDVGERYQQAGHLAEDLRRFLDDRPLLHAPELSGGERLRKWSRRHPRLTTAGVVALAASLLLLVLGCGLLAVRARLGDAEARERKQAFQSGTLEALCLLHTALEHQDNQRLGAQVCIRTLARYGLEEGKSWPGHPDWERLSPAEGREVAEDARELLLLLARARVQLCPGDPQTLRRALSLLDQAEALPGLEPSKALWHYRAGYLKDLGQLREAEAARRQAERMPAVSARDHYELAMADAVRGREGAARAIAALDRALEQNPRHYWSWVQRGLCRQSLDDHVQASFDLGVAVGLRPDLPLGHFNYGFALYQAGKHAEAVRAFGVALGCDPSLVPAYLTRGMVQLERQHHAEALADFDRARQLGHDGAALHIGQGIALEGLGRHQEADAAFARGFARGRGARLRWSYGFAVAARLPDRAEAAFKDVLKENPVHPRALYGLGMLAMRRGRHQEARAAFNRALNADPRFVQARSYRGVVLARLGLCEEARDDALWCLAQQPGSGPVLYAAACVAALTARSRNDPAAARDALKLLEQAARAGFSLDRATHDPDLAALHEQARFRQLCAPRAS
jgi:serine/threonine protein kinase/Tfp pilus assembly protein PilF